MHRTATTPRLHRLEPKATTKLPPLPVRVLHLRVLHRDAVSSCSQDPFVEAIVDFSREDATFHPISDRGSLFSAKRK